MHIQWLWRIFSLPGLLWLILLFVVPFYAVIGVAFGTLSPIFNTPIPIWNPLNWDFTTAWQTLQNFAPGHRYWGVALRTIVYVACAVGISLLIAYPVAYYISRYARRTKTILLVFLVVPFCLSYLIRMLAWVAILAPNGFINNFLVWSHIDSQPPNWLGGHPAVVVFALIYGYIPFMILPLIASLDRIDKSLMEASRDLGMTASKTFFRITLPLSKVGILSSCTIIALPMFGDYYTTKMVSGTSSTTMIGNQIYLYFHGGPQPNVGAVITLVLSAFLTLLMTYYLYSIAKAQKATS